MQLVRDRPGANATPALDHANDLRLGSSNRLGRVVRVAAHAKRFVLPLAANVGFVYFNRPAKRGEVVRFHRGTNPMQHEPRRLLCDPQATRNLIGRDAVTVACNQPDRRKPLGKANGRILKDGPGLSGELSLAIVAVPTPTLGHVGYPHRATGKGTGHAVRPTHLSPEVVRLLLVGELAHRFEHRLGNRLLVHATIVSLEGYCRQVYTAASTPPLRRVPSSGILSVCARAAPP